MYHVSRDPQGRNFGVKNTTSPFRMVATEKQRFGYCNRDKIFARNIGPVMKHTKAH